MARLSVMDCHCILGKGKQVPGQRLHLQRGSFEVRFEHTLPLCSMRIENTQLLSHVTTNLSFLPVGSCSFSSDDNMLSICLTKPNQLDPFNHLIRQERAHQTSHRQEKAVWASCAMAQGIDALLDLSSSEFIQLRIWNGFEPGQLWGELHCMDPCQSSEGFRWVCPEVIIKTLQSYIRRMICVGDLLHNILLLYRFGLPVNFQGMVVLPQKKQVFLLIMASMTSHLWIAKVKKLRECLNDIYFHLDSAGG